METQAAKQRFRTFHELDKLTLTVGDFEYHLQKSVKGPFLNRLLAGLRGDKSGKLKEGRHSYLGNGVRP